ncbi:GNAT family N-acetyltransferase [Pseudoroseomonas cervicalis]|uniref:Acetyltransferase, GNAT family n=1 Tax=Pseudoroseomonas cervicalis ATCC 49957 TaxID=525371 RepID=D5RUE2_9PROT|nr:GNAT family N-acetyltransferase [Pseudoroseomonas cervicalis]EFH09075.1 acetyltransferase, GNAT family [Pseudoroseomonas cervicalis ATCC 49957]
MSEPVLRLAGPDDLPGMLALYRHLAPEDPVVGPAEAAEAWAALLRRADVVLAEAGGMPVASCTLVVVPSIMRGLRPYALVENVVTHAGWRRHGLGHAVLGAALERARDAGCYKVMLATGSKNPGTLRFYETAGFTGGTKTFFEWRDLPPRAATA